MLGNLQMSSDQDAIYRDLLLQNKKPWFDLIGDPLLNKERSALENDLLNVYFAFFSSSKFGAAVRKTRFHRVQRLKALRALKKRFSRIELTLMYSFIINNTGFIVNIAKPKFNNSELKKADKDHETYQLAAVICMRHDDNPAQALDDIIEDVLRENKINTSAASFKQRLKLFRKNARHRGYLDPYAIIDARFLTKANFLTNNSESSASSIIPKPKLTLDRISRKGRPPKKGKIS